MTNKEKYLKDEVDIKEFANGINEAFLDFSYDYADLVDCIYLWLDKKVKLSLTEDEKVILMNIGSYKEIGRDNEGDLYLQDDCKCFINSLFGHLFQFIQPEEEYKISELLGGDKE